jgi:hypothetical protein
MEDREDLTSMVHVLSRLKKEGFALDFKVTEDGSSLCTLDEKQVYNADQVQIVNFYRFEGETNPDDMAILYVLETATGAKGTLTDAYGPYADEITESFMKQVEDLGKDLDKANYR